MISGLVQEAKADVLVHCSLKMRKPFLLPSEVLYMDFVEHPPILFGFHKSQKKLFH
jgi:hypothetical protein